MDPNQPQNQNPQQPQPAAATPQPQQIISPTVNAQQPATPPPNPAPAPTAQPVAPPQDTQQTVNQPQPTAPQMATPSPVANIDSKNPGKVLAIVSLVLAFLGLSLIGLVLAIIAKVKSKHAGFKSGLATVSIIINSLFIVITVGLVALLMILAMPMAQARSTAQAFTNDVVAGNYSGALSYTTDPTKEVDTTTAYLTHVHDEIGSSQNTISSASQDGYYGFVFKTNGNSTYYRVIVKDGKVYDASIDTVELKPLGSSNETTINWSCITFTTRSDKRSTNL